MKKLFLMAIFIIATAALFSTASAATVKIYANPSDDVVFYKDGTDRERSDAAWYPNIVYYSYDAYSGSSSVQKRHTNINFQLPGSLPDAIDIISVTFNFNVLSISNQAGDDRLGTFSVTGESVLASNGLGWQSFDVTKDFISKMNNNTLGSTYACNLTEHGSFPWPGGSAGFTFGSADGLDPAFLSITTSTVPVPTTIILLGSGILGLVGISRKKK